MAITQKPDLFKIREALEASWDKKTSYLAVSKKGNPALGQCYPTSRVIQFFFPETEIIKGKVWNGKELETHFWNGLLVDGAWYYIDLTWQQFPMGSSVREFEVLDSNMFGDSEKTIKRCDLLRKRVIDYLDKSSA
jgi:hypothetical protein